MRYYIPQMFTAFMCFLCGNKPNIMCKYFSSAICEVWKKEGKDHKICKSEAKVKGMRLVVKVEELKSISTHNRFTGTSSVVNRRQIVLK